ncbi:hypothetical protein NBRC111894_3143 [Sporolactobacillus inulinus]|uniref:DNA topology modulation protein FlaR n=1 Tax=Sporolactobacillus inulinus TaxID=2078 RepID=A0A4Y1ZEZ2_9BACL|nr:hypothetical protein [Sporolactobacillus inulinus]GAY77589.1 hypothetical protein NBRC111894_3143 [Sporolactobacillus inulinus]
MIRLAIPSDILALKDPCTQLGYEETEAAIKQRLHYILNNPDNGFLSMKLNQDASADGRTSSVNIFLKGFMPSSAASSLTVRIADKELADNCSKHASTGPFSTAIPNCASVQEEPGKSTSILQAARVRKYKMAKGLQQEIDMTRALKQPLPDRIHIIGSVGSGKTTLARRLSKNYNIPYYELDNVVWKRTSSGDLRRSDEERDHYLEQIVRSKRWIIEGAHAHHWVNKSFEAADLIIF